MEWVAFANTNRPFERTSNRTVLFNAPDEVNTARWLESAILTQQRADADLVAAYHKHHDVCRQLNDPTQYRRASSTGRSRHGEFFPGGTEFAFETPNFLHSRFDNPASDLTTFSYWQVAPLRGLTTISIPVGSALRFRRKASRIVRFHRFRTAAFPTLRPIDKPSRVTS